MITNKTSSKCESKVTITEIDKILRYGRKKVTYTRDEYNFFSVNGKDGELLTFFPIRSGKSGFRVIFSDFTEAEKSIEGTFKKEADAAEFFYDLLRKLCD